MNTPSHVVGSTAASSRRPYGTDAVILLGASCGGPEEYSRIAEELGYGRLEMPHPCDTQAIRTQLESMQ